MKVNIDFVEKKNGLLGRKKFHGVVLKVDFNATELAIINERNLGNDIIIERTASADTDPDKHAKKGLVRLMATAAVGGSNHFHLTIKKLLKGPDTYYLFNPIDAKAYADEVKEAMVTLKSYLDGNENEGSSTSFEL